MENNDIKGGKNTLSTVQNYTLFILRVVVGWHLLYEGVAKIFTPSWSSASYLQHSRWILADFFQWVIANPAILRIVDVLNILGLILIGLALITGCLSRLAAVFGALLLGMYYVAYPPIAGLDVSTVSEGHYLIVNKNLIEIIVLLMIAIFPADKIGSLGALFGHLFRKLLLRKEPSFKPAKLERRELVKGLLSLPVLGVFGGLVWKEKKNVSVDTITSPSLQIDEEVLKVAGQLSYGQIGDVKVSKLIMGANLIGGFAHSRDLIYVGDLFRKYNTEKKIFQTLMLAELSGVNSIILVPWQMDVVQKYNRLYKGNMQMIAMVDSTEAVDSAISKEVSAIYIIGNHADWTVRDGKVDELGELLDYIRSKGYTAGLGAHSIQTLMAAYEAGIVPDFYVKTLHHDNYWSAHPMENRIPFSVDTEKSDDHNQFHDNMFCLFPDKTIAFMEKQQIPWIAFKVLAGGAIHPTNGFNFAFKNGADFICVGMFDWQIVEDVNTTIDVIAKVTDRNRPWMA
ncbi:MAG: DoxX family membrane protein [Planctomycetota bacterium]